MRSVEEYQDQTEERWRKIAAGEGPSNCGWCAFSRRFSTEHCGNCPVVRVFGQECVEMPQVKAYYATSPYSAQAQSQAEVCLGLVREHREDLIVAARAILEEVIND